MNVIVDTAVWSLALRNNKRHSEASDQPSIYPEVTLLKELIVDGRVVLLGVVRQETLSGIRHKEQYETLKTHLRAFPNPALSSEDYELAADYFNICRQRGIQGSNTDFLICAVASRRQYAILTTDKDFENFSQHIPVNLVAQQ